MPRRPPPEHPDWDQVTHLLNVRSGGRCECCGRLPSGNRRMSRHHRRPRGMGGTSREDVHDLSNLLLLCGDGVSLCHGTVESRRDDARRRGLLVPQAQDPADVPIVLPSGRYVLLDPLAPFYRPLQGIESYWMDGPVPFVEDVPTRLVVKP